MRYLKIEKKNEQFQNSDKLNFSVSKHLMLSEVMIAEIFWWNLQLQRARWDPFEEFCWTLLSIET